MLTFFTRPLDVSQQILSKYRSYFPLHVYLHIYMITHSQYWRSNDKKEYFEKHAQKLRLEDVSEM